MDAEQKWICSKRIELLEARPSKNTSLKPVIKKLNEVIEVLNDVTYSIYVTMEEEYRGGNDIQIIS